MSQKLKIKITILFLALSFLLARVVIKAHYSRKVVFFAGTFSVDITPDVISKPVPLNGYGDRKKALAVGVHDRLFAKALFIESIDEQAGKTSRAVIVTTDLCMVNQFMRDAVLKKVAHLGINDSNFLLTATHTHSAPAGLDPRFPFEIIMGKYDAELFDQTVDGISEAVMRAHENLAPAEIFASQKEVIHLVRNRRIKEYDYRTRRFSEGAEHGEVDALMSVIKVASRNGAPLAILVVYGVHPTILGPTNLSVSADWPGVLQKELEEKIGHGVAMFANGAEGDQAPVSTNESDDFKWMEWYGEAVAEEAWDLYENSQLVVEPFIASAVSRRKLPRFRAPMLKWLPLPKLLTRSIADEALCMVLKIGQVVIIGLPGEPLHRVGIELRQKVRTDGAISPIIVGLANDWIGYIADPQSYKEGGYEADMTFFGRKEAGEVMFSAEEAYNKIFMANNQ